MIRRTRRGRGRAAGRGRANTKARLASLDKRFKPDVVARVVYIQAGRAASAWRVAYRGGRAPEAWLKDAAQLRGDLPPATRADPYLGWLAARINQATRRYHRSNARLDKRIVALAATQVGAPSRDRMTMLVELRSKKVLGAEEIRAEILLARSLFVAELQVLARNWISIVDWARSQHVDLGQYTAEQALEQATAFHTALIQLPAGMTADFGGSLGEIVLSWPDGWTLQRLRPEQLEREGHILHHCVATYEREAYAGHILSLRDPRNVPWVTVEVDSSAGYVKQVKGKRDALPAVWTKADFENWAPRLLQYLEGSGFFPDTDRWSEEARELLGEVGWLSFLRDGDLAEAEVAAQDPNVQINIVQLRDVLSTDSNWNAEYSLASIDWAITDGELEATWTVDLDVLQDAAVWLLGPADRWEASWDKARRNAIKNEVAAIPEATWRRLEEGAFVLAGYADIDATDDAGTIRGNIRDLLRQALAEHIVGGGFRVATYRIDQVDRGARGWRSRAHMWRAALPILRLGQDAYLQEGAVVFSETGESMFMEGTVSWSLPDDVDFWGDDDAVQDIAEIQEWRGAIPVGDGRQWVLEIADVEQSLKALLAYFPRRIEGTPSARMRQLEARGQLQLPFGQRGRRAQRGAPRRRVWAKQIKGWGCKKRIKRGWLRVRSTV